MRRATGFRRATDPPRQGHETQIPEDRPGPLVTIIVPACSVRGATSMSSPNMYSSSTVQQAGSSGYSLRPPAGSATRPRILSTTISPTWYALPTVCHYYPRLDDALRRVPTSLRESAAGREPDDSLCAGPRGETVRAVVGPHHGKHLSTTAKESIARCTADSAGGPRKTTQGSVDMSRPGLSTAAASIFPSGS
jgi:hypothetical protein